MRDFNKIPLVRNTNLSALFALGIADAESFLLTNGFSEGVSSGTVIDAAASYKQFLELNKSDPEAAKKFAIDHQFDSAEGLRGGHASKQICGLRNVLRNALTPLIGDCSAETKAQLEEIFQESETGKVTQRYNKLVGKAFKIMTKDTALAPEVRDTAAYLGKQVENVTREHGYFDTRRTTILQAHNISLEDDNPTKQTRFEKACERLAIIYRSAGNPGSPAGRKTDEGLPFVADCYEVRIPSKTKAVEVRSEDLSRC